MDGCALAAMRGAVTLLSSLQANIQMTRAIIDIVEPLGISVHDQIIVGKDGHASLEA
jgi:DNA repair protein RadC